MLEVRVRPKFLHACIEHNAIFNLLVSGFADDIQRKPSRVGKMIEPFPNLHEDHAIAQSPFFSLQKESQHTLLLPNGLQKISWLESNALD
jgi:hypothetical protein